MDEVGMKWLTILCIIAISPIAIKGALAFSINPQGITRRKWLSESVAKVSVGLFLPPPAIAADGYENPNMPVQAEERSGLIVLRVAEVAQFQEKILRAILDGAIVDVVVTPQQM